MSRLGLCKGGVGGEHLIPQESAETGGLLRVRLRDRSGAELHLGRHPEQNICREVAQVRIRRECPDVVVAQDDDAVPRALEKSCFDVAYQLSGGRDEVP
jgi:hypothetical protein